MQSKRRILFNSFTLASLLILITTAVFWIRSNGGGERFAWTHIENGQQHFLQISSLNGQFNYVDVTDRNSHLFHNDGYREWAGYSGPEGFMESIHAIYLAIASIILPMIWLIQNTKHKRRIRGICHVCSYDLRASKDRCPECGTPITLRNPKT